jgi:uncharacterized protein
MRLFIRSLSLLALATHTANAQSAFVHLMRGDTVQIEQFTKLSDRLDGEVVMKGGPRQTFSSRIERDGRLGTLTMSVWAAGAKPDAAALASGEVTIEGDTAVARLAQGTRPSQTQRIPSKSKAQPILNSSVAAFEVIIAAARQDRGGTPPAIFLATGGQTLTVTLSGLDTDSITAKIGPQSMYVITDRTGRVLRGGTPGAGVTFSRVDGIAVSKLRLAKPDYSAPANAPYSAEDVSVPTTLGHSLGGTLTRPVAANGPLPVVISISGSGAQDRDEYISVVPGGYRLFRQLADSLGRRGIAMLRLDDRGFGESGGDFVSSTSRDFANDVRAALAWVRTRSELDARRIYLLGHSEGGMIAPMVAVDEPTVAGLVLMAGPARTGRQILEFQSRYAIEHDTSLTPAARTAALAKSPATVDSVIASSPWLRFFASMTRCRSRAEYDSPY